MPGILATKALSGKQTTHTHTHPTTRAATRSHHVSFLVHSYYKAVGTVPADPLAGSGGVVPPVIVATAAAAQKEAAEATEAAKASATAAAVDATLTPGWRAFMYTLKQALPSAFRINRSHPLVRSRHITRLPAELQRKLTCTLYRRQRWFWLAWSRLQPACQPLSTMAKSLAHQRTSCCCCCCHSTPRLLAPCSHTTPRSAHAHFSVHRPLPWVPGRYAWTFHQSRQVLKKLPETKLIHQWLVAQVSARQWEAVLVGVKQALMIALPPRVFRAWLVSLTVKRQCP